MQRGAFYNTAYIYIYTLTDWTGLEYVEGIAHWIAAYVCSLPEQQLTGEYTVFGSGTPLCIFW